MEWLIIISMSIIIVCLLVIMYVNKEIHTREAFHRGYQAGYKNAKVEYDPYSVWVDDVIDNEHKVIF